MQCVSKSDINVLIVTYFFMIYQLKPNTVNRIHHLIHISPKLSLNNLMYLETLKKKLCLTNSWPEVMIVDLLVFLKEEGIKLI